MDDTFRQDSNSDEEAAASDILKLDYDHDDDVHKRKLDVLNLDEHQSEHDRAAGSPDRPKKLSASRPPTAATGGRLRVDEHFWLEEGNVILLVHDTYFKVHRSRLCKDNSVFSSLFSLPVEDVAGVEGGSWQRPIHFSDKPRRFANLLWALYALPAELKDVSDDPQNCLKLVDIAAAAQKYGFQTTENWAVSCLINCVRHADNVDSVVNPWRVFTIATLCQNDELRTVMIDRIIEKAEQHRLPWSWLVTIGEALNITELMGQGYYHTVIKGHTRWNEDGKLTDPQIAKLYVGFCKLVSYKDVLFGSPLPISHHACSLGAPLCRARWELMWKEALELTGLPSVHILGYLGAVLKYMRHNRTYMGSCRDAWITTMETKLEELRPSNRLYEFFKV